MSTNSVPSVEGFIPLPVSSAGKPCETWYKVFGTLKNPSGTPPPIVLHGGPGIPSDYLTNLSDLTKIHGRPVVIYDQIGNGKSTHLPEKNGDASFWTIQLFLDELDNVLSYLGVSGKYDLLGHSWGGMLAAHHAIRQPPGLRKLILSSSLADVKKWIDVQNKLREELPQEIQQTLTKHEEAGTTESEEYEEAVMVYYKKHVCRMDPWPKDFVTSMESMAKDPTVYHTMFGASEFHATGSLKDWSIVNELHKISVPTLLSSGRYDEAQDAVVDQFFKKIPRVKWVTFADSSHLSHHEEHERFLKVVEGFLED